MRHADEFVEGRRVFRQSKVEGKLFAKLRIAVVASKTLDCREPVLAALVREPKRRLLAQAEIIARTGETDQCSRRRIRLVHRDCKYGAVAKMPGLALSSEIRQNAYTVVR